MGFFRNLAALAFALALIALGCASTNPGAATVPKAEASTPAVQRPRFVGIWLTGLGLYGEGFETCVGLFLSPEHPLPLVETGAPLDAEASQAVLHAMESAPIVGTFRSAREAHAAAGWLTPHESTPPIWMCARYSDNPDAPWSFSRQDPPLNDWQSWYDSVPEQTRLEREALPLGKPDAGTKTGSLIVYALPPPLEQRGVVITRINPLHNAVYMHTPADLWTSVFTSYGSLYEAVGTRDPREIVHWPEGIPTFWQADYKTGDH